MSCSAFLDWIRVMHSDTISVFFVCLFCGCLALDGMSLIRVMIFP